MENGTTITIPILPGTQIDVTAGTINTSLNDKEVQSDAEVLDDVEEDSDESDLQKNKKPKPSDESSEPIASKPSHTNLNPFANQYVPYPNYAFNPNAQQFPQNAPNYPQSHNYPHHTQQYHQSPGVSPSSSHPQQTYFHQTFGNVPHLSNGGVRPSNQGSDSSEEDNDNDEVDSEEETQQSNAPGPSAAASGRPQKNHQPTVTNQIPSNLVPYYSYYNGYNPTQYYQTNFNGAVKNPNIPPQYSVPNQQYNQFNPYNYQPSSSSYYSNPQYTPNLQAVTTNSNKKKQKVKQRPNIIENHEPIESSTPKNTHNRATKKSRPTSNKKTKPQTEDIIEVVDADANFDLD